MNHTPAPWKADRAAVTASDGSRIADVFFPMAGGTISDNARLIAGAPILYRYVLAKAVAGDPEAVELIEAVERGASPTP